MSDEIRASTYALTPNTLAVVVSIRFIGASVSLWVVHQQHWPVLLGGAVLVVLVTLGEAAMHHVLMHIQRLRCVDEDDLYYEQHAASVRAVVERQVWPPDLLAEVLAEVPEGGTARQKYDAIVRIAEREVRPAGMTDAQARELFDLADQRVRAVRTSSDDVQAMSVQFERLTLLVEEIRAYRAAHGLVSTGDSQ